MAEHNCQYRELAEELSERVVVLETKLAEQEAKFAAELAQLKKALLGPKSERMPSPKKALGDKADPAQTQANRKAKAKEREEACVEEHEENLVADDERTCPACGNAARSLGSTKTSTVIDYVPGYFRRRVVHRETVACDCGDYIKTAPPPPRVLGQSKYGGGFAAHLVVSKLLDSIPVYRMEKRFKRLGVPMARSTMNALVLRAGEALFPVHDRLEKLVAKQPVVLADETSLPVVQKDKRKCKRGFVWTFNARLQLGDDDEDAVLVTHRYCADRSGQTPAEILGGTTGVLVVDGYTGYNAVTKVDGRTRAACLAHVRRKFFDARSGAPAAAEEALGLILDVYRVEHAALAAGIVRTPEHAKLRATDGREAMDRFAEFLAEHAPKHTPSSAFGSAIRHARNNWDRLTVFLDDVNVPVDNNASERALRPVAKGRDNWLFAGNDEAAKRLMALLGLCSTCEANGINPELYLADVLARLDTHPMSRVDELLPHRWAALHAA